MRPAPVAILGCEIVPDDWHARFSCIARHYEYRIVTRRAPLTFDKGLAWRIPTPLDRELMQAGDDKLLGRQDRQMVGEGKGVSVRVNMGGRRIITKTK